MFNNTLKTSKATPLKKANANFLDITDEQESNLNEALQKRV